jgi:hypothetical protein
MSDWNVLKPSDSSDKNVGTLSGLELTFARTELESCTTARTRNIAPKSVYWIEKSSEILWKNICGDLHVGDMSANVVSREQARTGPSVV